MESISKIQFIKDFGNIFEDSKWIAAEVYKKKPFKNFNDIKKNMIICFKKSSKKKKLKVLIKHPDLADKTKIAKLTSYSKKEQKDSNLNQCTPNEYYRFKELNKKYKNKFGFPFIMAVSGKKKYQILSSFEKRVMLKKKSEFEEATNQVIKIATLRLKSLENKYNNIV